MVHYILLFNMYERMAIHPRLKKPVRQVVIRPLNRVQSR